MSDLPVSDASQVNPGGRVIAASSAKTILDIAVFAELVRRSFSARWDSRPHPNRQIDVKAVTQPWIGYPLYTAGRTFRECRVHDGRSGLIERAPS